MRSFTVLAGMTTLAFVAAEEAAAVPGSVSVNPSTTNAGQFTDVTYDASGAQNHPIFVDFYLQGEISSGNPTAYFMLSRNEMDAEDMTLHSNVSIPVVGDTRASNWQVWAFATYVRNGRKEVGMISTPITIN